MFVYGTEKISNPSCVTTVSQTNGIRVGLWSEDQLLCVYDSKEVLSDIVKQYPGAKHKYLENNSSAQLISGIDFQKKSLDKYFQLTLLDDLAANRLYLNDNYGDKKYTIAYAVDKDQVQTVNNKVEIHHMLYAMLAKHGRSTDQVFLHIEGHRAFILVSTEKELKRCTSKKFDTIEDLLYEILLTYQKYGISKTAPCVISGGIDTSSKLFLTIKDYLSNVKISNIPSSHLQINNQESHTFYNMYLCKECV